jgi:hypothetical protein
MQKMNRVRQEQSFINKQISEEDEEDLQYLAEAGVLRLASGERPAGKRRGAGCGDGLDSHRGDISGEGSPHRSA